MSRGSGGRTRRCVLMRTRQLTLGFPSMWGGARRARAANAPIRRDAHVCRTSRGRFTAPRSRFMSRCARGSPCFGVSMYFPPFGSLCLARHVAMRRAFACCSTQYRATTFTSSWKRAISVRCRADCAASRSESLFTSMSCSHAVAHSGPIGGTGARSEHRERCGTRSSMFSRTSANTRTCAAQESTRSRRANGSMAGEWRPGSCRHGRSHHAGLPTRRALRSFRSLEAGLRELVGVVTG